MIDFILAAVVATVFYRMGKHTGYVEGEEFGYNLALNNVDQGVITNYPTGDWHINYSVIGTPESD